MEGSFPTHVAVYEVGPRDGLQNIAERLDVQTKVAFIERLAAAGLPAVEAGAFVSPAVIPQMGDTAEVFRRVTRQPGVRYAALVPNERGLDDAIEAGVDEVAVFTATSDTFNRRNVNATVEESFARFAPVVERALNAGLRVRGYVSTAFGCPYEGEIEPGAVKRVVERLLALGVDEVSVSDTIGVAAPAQVARVLELLLEAFPVETIALHFHDTRGTALANVLQALHLGVRIFDASAGGLGGCPFAPGATGNLATEDLLYLAGGLGIETGVDLEKVVDASLFMEKALGRPLPSRVLRARAAERGLS